jgi:hypothetical protein
MRKLVPLAFVAIAVVAIGLFAITIDDQASAILYTDKKLGGIVDKAPDEAFTVEITFTNTGKDTGDWSINVAFEGEKWTWEGMAQSLTLKPSKSKTLQWTGNVPSDAPRDSTARLVVYYGDSFEVLEWWIHVTCRAHLSITSSTVR